MKAPVAKTPTSVIALCLGRRFNRVRARMSMATGAITAFVCVSKTSDMPAAKALSKSLTERVLGSTDLARGSKEESSRTKTSDIVAAKGSLMKREAPITWPG